MFASSGNGGESEIKWFSFGRCLLNYFAEQIKQKKKKNPKCLFWYKHLPIFWIKHTYPGTNLGDWKFTSNKNHIHTYAKHACGISHGQVYWFVLPLHTMHPWVLVCVLSCLHCTSDTAAYTKLYLLSFTFIFYDFSQSHKLLLLCSNKVF